MSASRTRPVLAIALLAILACGVAEAQAQVQAQTPPTTATLEVSIAIPEKGGQRLIEYSVGDAHFHVVVRNVSDRPVTLWTAKYSWGWENLSFEVKDAAGAVRTVKKAPREWRKNFPDACTLQPKDEMVLAVDFTSADWAGAPKPTGTAAGGKFESLTMRAVYEVKPDDESRQSGVWTGRVESPWREYTLVP